MCPSRSASARRAVLKCCNHTCLAEAATNTHQKLHSCPGRQHTGGPGSPHCIANPGMLLQLCHWARWSQAALCSSCWGRGQSGFASHSERHPTSTAAAKSCRPCRANKCLRQLCLSIRRYITVLCSCTSHKVCHAALVKQGAEKTRSCCCVFLQ